ncbi:MAG: tetratricopeptide repeat protein [Nannocystis sp.]|nr:tetratricopeptide repeat protein [Nannocystis sp.]MBA3545594.1 tetratricopeptide repeat protein [Nannocystis sp.]
MSDLGPALAFLDRPCPFITFYSFKGGVGRSMAVINVAGIVAARGLRVLVIDMDLEAPGISYLANEAAGEAHTQPGFVDFLLDAVERTAEAHLFKLPADQALDRYCAVYPLPDEFQQVPGGSLRIMPAGRLDADYPGRLERLALPTLYREGSGLALMQAFKQVVQQSRLFDYVFIDSRTGFSDESGICTRDLADYLMVVSGLNQQNVKGTTQFLAALQAATPERKPLQVILSPIPNGEDALVDQRESAARHAFSAAWGSELRTDLHIPYHPQLALAEEPHIFRRRKGYLFDAYCRIERRLLLLLGDTPQSLTELAIAALKGKEYAAATALLQRARLLADTRGWIDSFVTALASTKPLPGVGDAGALYDMVTQEAPAHILRSLIDAIGARARSLWKGSGDLEAAEAMFRLILTADPEHADHLSDYALFLEAEREDMDAAQLMYERALDADPNDAHTLGHYATFLAAEREDLDAAELMFKRALDAAPRHADNLGSYALFLESARKDVDAAELMYKRALDVDPKDAYLLGNYGRVCLDTGRVVEGMELVDRAVALLGDSSPSQIDAECWMYGYSCGASGQRHAALTRLRELMEDHAIKTGDWDFSGVTRQAHQMGHPEALWLPVLTEVLAGRQPLTALDAWQAWQTASGA